MFKFNNKETRAMSTVSLLLTILLTLGILVPLLLTLNLFYIYTGKKSNKFNRLQIEVFFVPNISPPVYKPSPNRGPSNLSFVRIYAQGVLTGIHGISMRIYCDLLYSFVLYSMVFCNRFVFQHFVPNIRLLLKTRTSVISLF